METAAVESMHTAWNKENWQATLNQLRKDYPKYSDNELYVIWCHNHGRVPLDPNGKVIMEQWEIHASEDGRHLQPGGFKVSRPLYGRALKARKGASKPKQAPRGSRKAEAEAASGAPRPLSSNPSAFSPRAAELARSYDRAALLIQTLIAKRREYRALVDQFRDFPAGALTELAAHNDEAGDVLREVGLLKNEE
jgi:hypothetical protein